MKEKRVSRRSNKTAISLKRRWSVWFQRIVFFIKLGILLLVSLLIFTDYFDTYTKKARNEFSLFAAKYGFILENIIIEGEEIVWFYGSRMGFNIVRIK